MPSDVTQKALKELKKNAKKYKLQTKSIEATAKYLAI
jgi:hypothetical protein